MELRVEWVADLAVFGGAERSIVDIESPQDVGVEARDPRVETPRRFVEIEAIETDPILSPELVSAKILIVPAIENFVLEIIKMRILQSIRSHVHIVSPRAEPTQGDCEAPARPFFGIVP